MKKLSIVFVSLLAFTACGQSDMQACVDSCKLSLSSICGDDQSDICTEACSSDDDEVFNCVIGANDCDDIADKKNLCFSKPEYKEVSVDQEQTSKTPSCESVCQKYSTCAGFGEDVGEADMRDAYESCMVECPSWSQKGLSCMDSKEIKVPLDCMELSVCGAQEYNY